jgi:penicillin-binding protein 1C
MISKKNYKNIFFSLLSVTAFVWFLNILPDPLFQETYSTVVNDRHGKLLSARIAGDDQWRFPVSDSLPQKFIDCILVFEDQYFYQHPGINPLSLFRALYQNIKAGRIVSGGSTISMQCMRMARKNKARTIGQKLIEMLWTIRFEIGHSKDEILRIYASHAPFGRNIVGLEAASLSYYGRNPWQLSWGEMATLAVLPNAPSLIYPGKNQEKLLQKRNSLIDLLQTKGVIDNETATLAKEETLPRDTYKFENASPHLIDYLMERGYKGKSTISTIDRNMQLSVQRVIDRFYQLYEQNEINNMAALVVDVKKAEVLTYIGNTPCQKPFSGKDVDIIQSERSTGSILKPFLFALMQQDGFITPFSFVKDVPTQISGYTPKNFHKTYEGMVPANSAIKKSLNIPAVRMLQDYGTENFYIQLTRLGQTKIDKGPNHYGLSIILGGAESTLWDLSNAYLNMAQLLNDDEAKLMKIVLAEESSKQQEVFKPGSAWWTAETLSDLERPLQESGWKEFASSRKIAWKTGTSFGHRDAWAIGFTPEFLVAVWVGNATGEGRPGLTGVSKAAPIMFQIFHKLKHTSWFDRPDWDLAPVTICKESGYRASELCPHTKEEWFQKNARKTPVCPYHKEVQLDKTEKFRVNSSCYSVFDMKNKVFLVLPPIAEWYYKRVHPTHKSLPPFLPECTPSDEKLMDVVYPRNYTRINIPRLLDGTRSKVIFEVVHQEEETIFWHLNDLYLGSTSAVHRMEFSTKAGKYQMTLIDGKGRELNWKFEVME